MSLQELKGKIELHKYYALLELLDLVTDYRSVLRIGNAIIDVEDRYSQKVFKDCVDKKFNSNISYFEE